MLTDPPITYMPLMAKEVNIIKYLAELKVDKAQYADVNQELRAILKKANLALDK